MSICALRISFSLTFIEILMTRGSKSINVDLRTAVKGGVPRIHPSMPYVIVILTPLAVNIMVITSKLSYVFPNFAENWTRVLEAKSMTCPSALIMGIITNHYSFS